jgi:phospholipid transport system substrate-binding protein
MSWSGIAGNRGNRSVVPAAALVLVAVSYGVAWAESPTETLQGVFAAVNRALGDPELQQKPQELMGAIHNVIHTAFDFREAARLAMGREWEARTPTEQDEFVQLFAALLQRAYVSQMASPQSGMQGGLAIRYTGESVDGDRATVATVMGSRSGKEMPLGYRMIQEGERWAVYDVEVGGMSLVASYRAQFSKVIRQSSYADLVVRLKNTRGN